MYMILGPFVLEEITDDIDSLFRRERGLFGRYKLSGMPFDG